MNLKNENFRLELNRGSLSVEISICSREKMEQRLSDGKIENTAIISFHDPLGESNHCLGNYSPIDFTGKCDRIIQIGVHDIDREMLGHFGMTEATFFPEAQQLADFIHNAIHDGLDIICQCEYGHSRSSGCAAAILEHFGKRGIDIFADYRYNPNQLLYHKVIDALKNETKA